MAATAAAARRDRTHWLYIAVIDLDVERARAVFAGERPFDESTMVDDHDVSIGDDEVPPPADDHLVRT